MNNFKWLPDHEIQIAPPKRPKKLTGTRFAAIMGLNKWTTPFKVWCEVTRTWQEPFIETKYTKAGKAIEPKQAEYMRKSYFMRDLVTPTDIWGKDYFKKTYGDFFQEVEVLGGSWDFILKDEEGKPYAVLEMKTSKRVEDWAEDIPEYYALQAALYAYLLGVDQVYMVASFLEGSDYDDPDKFVCTSENTIVRPFRLSERYPTFKEDYVNPAYEWWEAHVITGVSPTYDEKLDADILKDLRTNNLSPEMDQKALFAEAESLKQHIEEVKAGISADEKRYKELCDMIKELAISKFRDGDTKVSISGGSYEWELSRSTSSKLDTSAMIKDGIYGKYVKESESYRLTSKKSNNN